MNHCIIGYAMNPSLSTVTREDTGKLTHLNLAFGLIKDGLPDLSILPDIRLIDTFRLWNPALKVVLSIGGWGAGGFSTMAMTAEGRKRFADACLALVEEYRLDGIDIDWEYPCSDLAGIDADPRDRANFTLLLSDLREALGRSRILSIAAGGDESFIQNTEMDKVAEIVDYVQLMTYDLRGGFSSTAGHHAALSASRGDTSKANARAVVEMFHDAGVPYGKMVLGAAFYARSFAVSNAENNGILQPSGIGEAGPTFGEITEQFLEENQYKEYWDEEAEAAYLFNGKVFVSFESEHAIRLKCGYVKEKELNGIMYWEHGNDPTRTLLTAMAESLAD